MPSQLNKHIVVMMMMSHSLMFLKPSPCSRNSLQKASRRKNLQPGGSCIAIRDTIFYNCCGLPCWNAKVSQRTDLIDLLNCFHQQETQSRASKTLLIAIYKDLELRKFWDATTAVTITPLPGTSHLISSTPWTIAY